MTDEQLFIERNLFYSSGEHSATVVKERLRSNLKFGKIGLLISLGMVTVFHF